MIKTHYQKEIEYPCDLFEAEKPNKDELKAFYKKVQEWLNLWRYRIPEFNYLLSVDGIPGDHTEMVLDQFQRKFKLIHNGPDQGTYGKIDEKTFHFLVAPLKTAFAVNFKHGTAPLRKMILYYADLHIKQVARELGSNQGPWVRSYCGGKDGKDYPWCMGFVTAILDLAYSSKGLKFTDVTPKTLSCDKAGSNAKKKGILLTNEEIRKMTDLERARAIKPGDVFLIRKSAGDWTHTGLVGRYVSGGNITTREGNTNDEGSRDGYEACERLRNLLKYKIDIIQLPTD